MDSPTERKPFPPWLHWALLAALAMFALAIPVGTVVKEGAMLLVGASFLIQLIAVPIATVFLMRGHGTRADRIITAVAAAPCLLLLLGLASVMLGFSHFHI